MPSIQFDVLIPDANACTLYGAFATACRRLVDHGCVRHAAVRTSARPVIAADVEEVLRHTPGLSVEQGAHMRRYDVEIVDAQGSLNELAMGLSRLLTPQANLPADPLALLDENRFELPASYPWWVEVRR